MYQSDRTRVVRIPPDGQGHSVIRKEAREPGGSARLSHEAAILRRLDGIEGVPRLVDHVEEGPGLTLEDVAGTPLSSWIRSRPGTVELLDVALRVSRVLAQVHRRGVVHKDVNPSNVLVGARGGVVLIDFDLASTFAEERPGFTHESRLAGTLAYLAPEQTGRTGRPVDHRADLYALGATLYELATSQPPFGSGDTLHLIHQHLARVPTPPAEVDPSIPAALSRIVLRLLEKEPDQRYQSADGLAHDLARLRDLLASRGGSADGDRLVLGERDFPLRLRPPSRPVGRTHEIQRLVQAFDDARRGLTRAIFIAGASGVGKTTLIDELRPVVTASRGWFVTGKFDQYRKDTGADALQHALGSVARLVLAEPEAELAAHRERILAALGPNAGLATSLVPELGLFLGPDHPPPSITDPLEARARVVKAGLDVLGAIASPDRPVVMVLDDLQWATATSLALIDGILHDDGSAGLLLVGAYRHDEVDAAHPLSAVFARWESLSGAATRLELTNLPGEDLAAMIGDMLRLPPSRAAELAQVVLPRTAGNPYDTAELLNALWEDGVLVQGEDGWRWDAATISTHVGHGDVVELLAARIDRLPQPARRLLDTMACLGGEVDHDVLAVASGLDACELDAGLQAAQAMAGQLQPALEDGLLVMATDGDAFLFRHDRVQQAAHTRLDENAGRRLRLELARRLSAVPRLESLAAEQYLPVADRITDPAEKRRVVTLLWNAATTHRLINYPTAERFLSAARSLILQLLDTEPGEPALENLLTDLEIERHAALHNLGRLDDADGVHAMLMARCDDPRRLASATAVQIRGLTIRGRAADAIRLGLTQLEGLGVVVPAQHDLHGAAQRGVDRLRRWAGTDTLGTDLDRPPSQDPRVRAAAALMEPLATAAFVVDPVLLCWLVSESQRLWVEHGPLRELFGPLAMAPPVAIAMGNDHRAGYQASRRVVAVGEARGYDSETSAARLMLAGAGMPWQEPLEEAVHELHRAREGLMLGGNLELAAYADIMTIAAMLDCAPTLDGWAKVVEGALAFTERTGNDYSHRYDLPYRQLARALTGQTRGVHTLTDDEFDEAAHLRTVSSIPICLLYYHLVASILAVVAGDHEGLTRHAEAMRPVSSALQGFYVSTHVMLLSGLSLAWRIRDADAADRLPLLPELDAVRDWMAARAREAPSNFRHLMHWLDAERAWALGDEPGALRAFDASLTEVRQRRRPWHHALVAERTGHLHLGYGLRHTGEMLLTEAHDRYQSWGATAKVSQLHARHAFLAAPTEAGLATSTADAGVQGTGRLSGDTVDLLAVFRAAQELSSQTNLDRLRASVVDVLAAMTGATAVRMLLRNEDASGWFLPTETEQDGGAAIPLEEAAAHGLLPLTAFLYAERTGQPLLVTDATRDDRFARDPYLADLQCCSLLVVPVKSHGVTKAMLVLENRLSGAVFTGARLDAVVLIAGQLAVSLENALAERFRSLVHRSSDLTLVCGRDGVLSYVSAAATEILGRDGTAMVGQPVRELIHPGDRTTFDAWFSAPEENRGQSMECRVIHGDGSHPWVLTTLTDLRSDPAVGGLVLHLRDVTERRRLEEDLRHAQKLESIGQLAAGIAHEINTPIQFIGDNVRFLSDTFAGLSQLLTPPSANPIGQGAAEGSAEHLADLLTEVPSALKETLDGVSRVATIVRAMKTFGHLGEEKAMSDLNEAVRSTLVVATSELRDVADVVTDLGDLPPVWCVPGDINQALLNLVVNAAHAVDEAAKQGRGRGTITVRTRREDDHVRVDVIDTGVGIPPDIADRIFEQFFTTKPIGVGTGQGLALTHTLIQRRHGGTVTFASAPGVGSTFTIRIPHHPSTAPDTPED